ncbi:MAG: lipopolysaccharide biosynthesis protein [Dysgonamonadaceae bacterium]|nr:lipopolysaccharide biosynthesis protein [Dysgonamonadaceae bacterium]
MGNIKIKPVTLQPIYAILWTEISIGTKIYLYRDENLFTSGRKFICIGTEIYLYQDENLMAETTLKQKTAKGLFWGGFGSAAQQVIGLGFGIYFARMLTPSDYGMIGLLSIFSGIAGTLVNAGFSTALINRRNVTHRDYNAVFWFSFSMSLFLYIVLFFASPLIAAFFKKPELTALSRVMFLSFCFGGAGMVSYTILFRQLKTKQLATIEATSLLVACFIGMTLVMNGFTYWAIAIQSIIYISLAVVLRMIVARWTPTLHFDFSPLKEMLPFSVKLLFTGIFAQINANVFSVLLGKFYSITDVGNYSQGQKWMSMGHAFINTMISYVTQPVLAQVNDERNRQIKVLRKLIRFGAFVSFPMMLGLAFAGREFIVIAIGEKWLPAVPFLQLFCVWGAAGFLWTLYTNLICTQGKSNIHMYVSITVGLLQLTVVLSLYPLGIYPMVAGYIFMYFTGLLIWHYFANKLIGLRLREVLSDTLPYLGISLVCFGITRLLTANVHNIYLLFTLKIMISGLLYVAILRISKSVIFRECVEFFNAAAKQQVGK